MVTVDPSQEILFEGEGQVATITFNRPEAMNAMDPATYQELTDAWIERWDARVDRWAAERGVSLADRPASELRPWGYAMEVEGALVWTDEPG